MTCASNCACHCHSGEEDIPPGHLETCAFADPDYMPGDFIPGDIVGDESELEMQDRFNAEGE